MSALRSFDRYGELHERLQREMAAGFAGIARARFLCPRGISQLDYDQHMRAARVVDVSADEEPHCVLVAAEKDEGDEEERGKEGKKKERVRPAQWFGYLVPEGLRSAETHFGASLQLVVELADALIATRLATEKCLALDAR